LRYYVVLKYVDNELKLLFVTFMVLVVSKCRFIYILFKFLSISIIVALNIQLSSCVVDVRSWSDVFYSYCCLIIPCGVASLLCSILICSITFHHLVFLYFMALPTSRISVIWGSQKRGGNVNCAMYCEVLLEFRDAIRRKRPDQLARGLLFHHGNARPHTA
jgi:hypothetical protein